MPLTRLKGALFSAAAGIGFFLIVLRPHSKDLTAMNPSTPPWLITAALMVVIAASLYGALYYARRAWRLADTPIARIRSAPQGYVELYGRAVLLPGEPILAPLSYLPCVWYRYQVEERTEGGRWWPVDSGVSDHLFALADGAAQCVIDPEGAECIKTRRDVWHGDQGGARIYAAFGIGATYRYTEQRIMPGEELHVIGGFRTVGGLREAPDTKRDVAELLERWKRDPQRMDLFDRRRNGRIDPDEWEAVRRAAYLHVQREQLEQATHPDVHLMSNTGDPARPFIIAAFREESRLIRYFQWRSAGCLLPALLAGGTLLML